ncbi:hypothetical protein FQ186_16860 [Pseudomonas sp. ANT_H14]|uniref:GTPase-associated system all-helical protein GASH n=1 Tax=unclassified Pseudomonas TaxID=196821 RepID=UPI0011ECE6FA|nr:MULTISPECIES: GTPase-associated system all-helical protein GASH [unclassified Pseudomonas]KAA0950160.1 hypothetical protein FQ182_00015 [Pseudomonas sp. ANT_H4]KAA0951441.1 hypothetical protein FQ186_16860 [Pseudomonas sp. ANT_H14]
MASIASHVRIFDANPADDLVAKRTSAVKELATLFQRSVVVGTTLNFCDELVESLNLKSELGERLAEVVEIAISNSAKAFIADGKTLELRVCGMLGALQAVTGQKSRGSAVTTSDIFSLGLWCGLTFQSPIPEPRFEALRVEVLKNSQAYASARAALSRERVPVPKVQIQVPDIYDPVQLKSALKDGVETANSALRANAAVDREEIDLLWWVLTDWSDILNHRFSTAQNPTASAIAAGIEAGSMLRRMPEDTHRHLVLRHVNGAKLMSLNELIKALGKERELIISAIEDIEHIKGFNNIFPLMNAIISDDSKHPNAKQKRSLEEWATRALLERTLIRICTNLPSVGI